MYLGRKMDRGERKKGGPMKEKGRNRKCKAKTELQRVKSRKG
jgi:hypothetical protein